MIAAQDTILVALLVVCATLLLITRAVDETTGSSLLAGALGYAGRSGIAAARRAKTEPPDAGG